MGIHRRWKQHIDGVIRRASGSGAHSGDLSIMANFHTDIVGPALWKECLTCVNADHVSLVLTVYYVHTYKHYMEHVNSTSFVLSAHAVATMADNASYGLLDNASVVVEGETISWVGKTSELPEPFSALNRIALKNQLITPGLVDCHTHLVHGGHRADEFEQRLSGKSYAEIAQAGGGIASTVAATRDASIDDLVESALPRLDALLAEGVCTIEIKSGYGLDADAELNMLRAARRLEDHRAVRVKTSFLGAHAVPPEFSGRADAYLDTVCLPTLRQAHAEGLVDAVDGFCESIAFTAEQLDRVFQEARTLGLPVKIHGEQLSRSGGTQLVASHGGLSADHIEYADAQDVVAMKAAGTAAVLLPGAYYTLKENQKPPVTALRQHKVPIALATDCNPGSSPMTSILLAMNMGCTLFGLTPHEALAGVTRNAARALGLQTVGELRAGTRADLCSWNITTPAELSYRIGFNPLQHRIFGGRFDA